MVKYVDRVFRPVLSAAVVVMAVAAVLLTLQARAFRQQKDLLAADLDVIHAATNTANRKSELLEQLSRTRRRMFAGERVAAEAAALRYVAEAAALSKVSLTTLQIKSVRPGTEHRDRIAIELAGGGDYPSAVEFLRLLQAPWHRIEQLRITPAPAPDQHKLAFSGTVWFFNATSLGQGGP